MSGTVVFLGYGRSLAGMTWAQRTVRIRGRIERVREHCAFAEEATRCSAPRVSSSSTTGTAAHRPEPLAMSSDHGQGPVRAAGWVRAEEPA